MPPLCLPSGRRAGSCAIAFCAIAFCVVSLSAVPGEAQPIEVVDLATIIYSATASPRPAAEVASTVTVITADDIARAQHRTVPDILNSVPGLNLVQSGGLGGQTAIFMRGTNPNHIRVLVDGIDVTDPSTPTGTFDFGHLQAVDIERVEVLRGPQSGLYGSDAIGGVIAVTTRRGSGQAHVRAGIEAGSFATFNQWAGVSGGSDRFDYAFDLGHVRADEVPVTPPELVPPGRPVLANAYDNWTASGRVGARLSDNASISFTARYTGARLDFVGDDFSFFPAVPAAGHTRELDRQLFLRGELATTHLDGRFESRFGVSYSDLWKSLQEPPIPFGPTPASVSRGDRIAGDWQGTWHVAPDHTIVAGLSHQRERLWAAATEAANANSAGYLELQSAFDGGFFVAANLRYDVNRRFGGHLTWRVAPGYVVPTTETILRASYGTGFKAPTLSQLFVDFPAFNFFANPALLPETSRGYDFGFEQPLFDGQVTFGATWFHNDISQLIVANATFDSYENLGRATTEGLEAFAALRVTDDVTVRADYTFTRARDAGTGRDLLRRPRHKGSATITWTPAGGLSVSATLLAVGSWIDGNRDFSIPRMTAPGYAVVNLAASYEIGDHATVFARVENLFGARYQDPTGFLRPGRGIYAGLRFGN